MLLQEIEGVLTERGFDYCEYSGCFDIAARKERKTFAERPSGQRQPSMLLIKVLSNIDSFQEEQARNLKILSRELDARSLLVGLHTRREALSDNIVYDRFDIPALNPRTLESILNGLFPEIYRFRGGLFVEISPETLRDARQNAGLSQSELASRVGVTKKSIYEHESRKLKIMYKNALKIERILKTKIITPLDISFSYETEAVPRSDFETKISRNFRKIGFDTDFVYQSPFNMIAKEKKFMLLSDVEESKKQIQKNIPYISGFSRLVGKSAVIITKEEFNFGIPTIREDELASMQQRDIKRLIKNW
ncbi:MAG: helix-turn-helix domain-containing protein [Candidatus Aenigmarchaeota archaeon]|nr:helix-turn-helix domain-containing protein [Candidatus Aenigmarchaeota archaeon]